MSSRTTHPRNPSGTGRSRGARRPLGALTLGAVAAISLAALSPRGADSGSVVSEAAANELAAKIAVLTEPSARASGPLESVSVSETEANSYLKLRGREFLPPAVHDPEIHILPDHIAGAAEVDFNELEQIGNETDDWGTKLVAMVFRGKQHVQATGKLETNSGQGRFTLTSLTVGPTALPAAFVNFMLQSYMEKRYKIDLSKPFQLPPHVTHIELGNGHATLHRLAPSRH